VNYLAKLDQRIHAVANGGNEFYNYLAIVQSSGYGKTRAALELAKTRPLIYICFRKEGSTGYPPATPQSKELLKDLWSSDFPYAERIALSWIRSMIRTYCQEKTGENYRENLLNNLVKYI
jgi:hypothetical protein